MHFVYLLSVLFFRHGLIKPTRLALNLICSHMSLTRTSDSPASVFREPGLQHQHTQFVLCWALCKLSKRLTNWSTSSTLNLTLLKGFFCLFVC